MGRALREARHPAPEEGVRGNASSFCVPYKEKARRDGLSSLQAPAVSKLPAKK